MTRRTQSEEPAIDLSIPVEKVCHVIDEAKEFAEEEVIEDPDAPEPEDAWQEPEEVDEGRVDPLLADLQGFIAALTFDEQVDLVALMWMGRDDHTAGEWASVRTEAADAHNEHTAEYLCGNPMLADHLSEGLSLIGYSCDDYERGHA